MTEQEFLQATGCMPDEDDLERANCDKAGQFLHFGCGVCEHGKPVFMCPPCFIAANQKGWGSMKWTPKP